MIKALKGLALCAGFFLIGSVSVADSFDEGIEYKRIIPPVKTSTSKIEVVEMFWYGCPHCYSFEPKLNKWKESMPNDVELVKIPAIFQDRAVWELHARAYYAAELLGILDKSHQAVFDYLHKQRKHLHNEDEVASFYSQFGVDKQVFKETLRSFGVEMKVNRARDLTRRYKIDGVPSLIVNGKYLTHASLTNGQAGMLKVVDFLIKKEAAGQ